MELSKDAARLEFVAGHLTSAQHAFFRPFFPTKKKKKQLSDQINCAGHTQTAPPGNIREFCTVIASKQVLQWNGTIQNGNSS